MKKIIIAFRILLISLPLIALLAGFSTIASDDDIPPVNRKIVEFCEKHMNKRVGNGQCWDLAKYALDYAEADWHAPYSFGLIVDYRSEEIYPGDIIQFERVKIVENGQKMWAPHHTAIVFKVIAEGKYTVAQQNFNGVKRLKTADIDFNYLVKGKVTFFRPQEK